MGTAAITKYCITTILAQPLLGKHRHSKKPTSTKSQQVTLQGYYLHSKDIDRILIVYFFQDLLAGTKFKMIQIFHVRTTEER